jgi:hypothetical protein
MRTSKHLPLGDGRLKNEAQPELKRAKNITLLLGLMLLAIVVVATLVQDRRYPAGVTAPGSAADPTRTH